MKRFARRILIAVSLLIVGAVLGPVSLAAVAAYITSDQDDEFGEHREAARLVDAYQDNLRPGRLFLTLASPEDGAECAYDPDQLFPNSMQQFDESTDTKAFTDYVGYLALDRWRNRTRNEEWIGAVAVQLNEQMSDFETGFLRRCIEGTVFSQLCMERVEAFSNSAPRFDHSRDPIPVLGMGIENEIVCTYADGVAARLGLPIAERGQAAE